MILDSGSRGLECTGALFVRWVRVGGMGGMGGWGGVALWFGRDGCGEGEIVGGTSRFSIPEEAKKKAKNVGMSNSQTPRTHALTHSLVIVIVIS